MPWFLEVLLIAGAGAAVDVLYTIYFKFVESNNVFMACLASMGLGALSLFGLSSLIKSKKLAAVWILGLGLGTYIALVCLGNG